MVASFDFPPGLSHRLSGRRRIGSRAAPVVDRRSVSNVTKRRARGQGKAESVQNTTDGGRPDAPDQRAADSSGNEHQIPTFAVAGASWLTAGVAYFGYLHKLRRDIVQLERALGYSRIRRSSLD